MRTVAPPRHRAVRVQLRRLLCGWLLAGLLSGAPAPGVRAEPGSPAAVPVLLHYQGRFTDPSGQPLAGPVDLVFSLYPVSTGGSPLWTETQAGVVLNQGVATVLLGSVVALPTAAFGAATRYLQITADGTVLEPRLTIASVPFALEAERLGGRTADQLEPAGAVEALAQSLRVSDGSGPNEGENRVHWDQLVGVPGGFADGNDDGGAGSEDHGNLSGLGDDDHPQYLLRFDAQNPDGDPPNEGSNVVHWENLVGVPSGLADGVDDVFSGSGGEITGGDIKDSTLTAVDVAPRSLTGGTLAPATITGFEVALETLDGDNIRDDGIRSPDILDGTIASIDLKDGSVATVDLADGAVTSAKIADGTIQIQDVAFLAGDITAVLVGQGLIGGGESGDVSLSVGAGSGITVTGSSVSLSPSYLSGSAYDSRFVSSAAPSWTPVAGAVSVSATAFRPVTPTGKFTVVPAEGYLFVDSADNAGAEDEFTAPIHLPHGAIITALWVTYWDNTSGSLEVTLWRARQNGSTRTTIASVLSGSAQAAWRTDSDTTITETSVDNIEFVYWLEADFPGTPQGNTIRLLSARVEYTVATPH